MPTDRIGVADFISGILSAVVIKLLTVGFQAVIVALLDPLKSYAAGRSIILKVLS